MKYVTPISARSLLTKIAQADAEKFGERPDTTTETAESRMSNMLRAEKLTPSQKEFAQKQLTKVIRNEPLMQTSGRSRVVISRDWGRGD